MDQKSDQWIQDAVLSTERMNKEIDEIWEECKSIDVKIEKLKAERNRLETKWRGIKDRKDMIMKTVEEVWKVRDMFQPQ
jgi:phage shock protein A